MILKDQYSNSYKKGELGMDFEVPVTKQDYLKRMKHYYGMYAYGATSVGFGGFYTDGRSERSFKELRDIARGRQGVEKFKDILDPADPVTGDRSLNISWDPLRVLSKFRDIIKDKFLSIRLGATTEAVDDTARMERLLKKNQITLTRQKDTQAFLSQTSYTPQDDVELQGIDTEEDVDFLYKMGGIRLAAEIMMKDGIDFIIGNSKWDIVWPMVVEDLIDIYSFGVDQMSVNGKEQVKYVDPAKVIIPPSIYPDHRDCDFRGYVEYMQLADLALHADFTADEMRSIKSVMDKGNQVYNSDVNAGMGWREEYTRSGLTGWNFSEFGVPVLKMYFMVQDEQRYIVGKHKRGSNQFEPVGKDFKLTDRMAKAGKRIVSYPVQYLYQCSWIVGTEVVFNEGLVDTVVRQGESGSKEIVWPMTFFMGSETSLVERMLSFDHDIQIANFKLRSLIAKLPPAPRMILYKSRLSDTIKIGDRDYTILDMVQNYQRHGIMVLEDGTEYSMPGEENGMTQKPMDLLPSGIDADFALLEARIQNSIDKIRQVTGLNEFADGTSTDGEALSHVVKSMSSASNSALRPHIDTMVSGYKAIITHIGLKNKQIAMSDEVDLGYLPISDDYVKPVSLSPELSKYEWGINVEVESMESIQMLMADLQARRDMLPAAEYFVIWNTIKGGDTKKAEYLIAKYTEAAKKRDHDRSMEIAQAQASGNAQAAVAGEEAKAKTEEMVSKLRLIEMQTKHGLDEQSKVSDHQRAIDLMERTKDREKEIAVATVEENNRNRLNQ